MENIMESFTHQINEMTTQFLLSFPSDIVLFITSEVYQELNEQNDILKVRRGFE